MRIPTSVFAAGLLLGSSLVAPKLEAHHSFAAEFDGHAVIRLTGVLTKVDWSNPHSYFYVDVKDPKGKVVNWGCEAGAPGALSRRGLKKIDLKIGDSIVVDGYRAKDGSNLVDARRLTLADGRTIFGGSQGDGGPGDGPGR
jgi:hypothetical protein